MCSSDLVEVGLYNDRLIQVRTGLAVGDRVRLDALVATESSPGENGEGRTDEGESNQRTNFPKAVPLAPTLAPTNAPAAGKPALTRSPLLPAKPEFGKLSAPAPQKPVAPGK